MEEAISNCSGRVFSEEDLALIRWTRKTYPKLSRFELAATICEILDWQTPGGTAIRVIEPIRLRIAEDSQDHLRWRSYVDQCHQLDYRQAYGSRLQYYICSGEREPGCLQYSASAWAPEERDRWIGRAVEDRKVRLHLVANTDEWNENS